MTLQDSSGDQDHQTELAPIASIALLCQQSYAEWAAATGDVSAEAAQARYRANLELLWEQLADDLRRVARGWIRSNIAPDIESLALNMFANIVFNLPRLRIDPVRNVRMFLVTVARRGLIDEYRRSYAASGRRRAKSADEVAPQSGMPAARMWQAPGTTDPAFAADTPAGAIDPESYTAEERLAARIDQQALLAAIWAYWPNSLSADDLRIVTLRWEADPPCSFREIAEQLGPNWSEEGVRQRHHRILKATRAYLRKQGLLDDEPTT